MADAAAAGPAVIVFHQEDQRQLPELGQVQRLVENSFLHGAIAEKDHRHRARFLNLRGKSRSGGERKTAADYGRGVNDSQLSGGNMKCPRAPAAVAGFSPDDLGQNFFRVAAFSDDVAMISVRAKDIIRRSQGCTDGNTGRFLPDVNVEMTTNQVLVVLVEADDMLFGAPDHEHLA